MNCSDVLPFIFTLKSVLLLVLLCAASVQDFRTLSVSNHLWLAGVLLLFPVIVAEIFILGVSRFFDLFISAGFFFLFSAVCFYFRFFGGADGKAFLLISLAFPFKRSDLLNPFDLLSSVPLAALLNSLSLSLIFFLSFCTLCFFKKGTHSNQRRVFPAGMMSCGQALTFPVPFMPSIAGGFISALCGVDLVGFLFCSS